ncbi:MAG: trypsin-like peptidase domain-containing protein [Planctomycetota bacterium]|jgi:serine protease Do
MRSLVLLTAAVLAAVVVLPLLDPADARGESAPQELRSAPPQPTAEAKGLSRPFIDATKLVRPAVVRIHNLRRYGRRYINNGGGSGFIISKQGYVLTNRHVVLDASVLVVELADGRTFEKVKLLGQDPRSDLAVIRIDEPIKETLPTAQLGDSDTLEVGEWVIAIGSPFRLASSVSVGVVSATGRSGLISRQASEEFIQTDAALNPGNSGGPLINLDGQVVGINTAIQTAGQSKSSAGVGFAIPVNLARTVAISLIERGVAKRGWLGIKVSLDRRTSRPHFFTRDELDKRGIRGQGAVQIAGTEPGSPAEKAGIRKGDFLTEVDGRPLKSMQMLNARLSQAGPGGTVTLTLNGKRKVSVTLEEERTQSYGIEVADLDARKAAELGMPASTKGVVVERIQPGSLAERAEPRNRLMPGDVITGIAWRRGETSNVTTKRDFEQVMARLQAEAPGLIRFYFRTREGEYKADLYPR